MLKIRVTFVDNEKGNKELSDFMEMIEKRQTVLNQSRIYKGRNNSKYSNVYLDIEER